MRKLFAALTLSVFLFSGCSLFKKDPQEAVNQGVQNLAAVKQGRSKTIIHGVVQAPTGETPQKMDVNFEISGYSDTRDMETPTFDLLLKATVALDDKKGAAELQLRSVEKKLYLKLNSLTLPGEQNEIVRAQVQSLTNNWWQIPLEESPLKDLTDKQKDLTDKFKTLTFFKNAQEDGTDSIEGVDATRYRIEVNKDAVKEFLLALAKQEGNVVSPQEEKAISDSLNDLEFTGAASIGDDDIAHRIKGTLSMQPDQGALSSFDIDYSGWDFGTDATIEVPEGAKDFNSFVFLPLIGALSAAQPDGVSTPTVTPTTPAPATPTAPKGTTVVPAAPKGTVVTPAAGSTK